MKDEQKRGKQCVKSLRLTFPAVDVPVNFIIIIVISGLIWRKKKKNQKQSPWEGQPV